MNTVLFLLSNCIAAGAAQQPPPFQLKAATARWIAHNANYGIISTFSRHLNGIPFGNIASFSDGTVDNSTGELYFFLSPLDASMQDISKNPHCSMTISEQQVDGSCNKRDLDPEDPRCARLTFSGAMVDINSTKEGWDGPAQTALWSRHPQMKSWVSAGGDHNFGFYKLNISDVWLIDMFGGATLLTPEAYFKAKP